MATGRPAAREESAVTGQAARPLARALRWIGALFASLPCLYLSWVLFSVWADPLSRDGGSWVRFGVGLMVLEFVLLHSGAFMAVLMKGDIGWKKRGGGLLGMAAFYGLMAWGFSAATDSPGLLWIFAAVVAGRIVTAFTNREAGFQYMMARSAIGVFLYLVITFGTVFIPIPEWGITNDVVSAVYPDRGTGVWEQHPERAVAGAAVYFLLMGLVELFILAPAVGRAATGRSDAARA